MTAQAIKKPQQKKRNSVNSKGYQKALDLAEAGQHEAALECIQKYARTAGSNAEILNDTGAILYCLNRSDEAIEYFLKAKQLQPDSAEILWNLSETYLSQGRAKEAMQLFDEMHKIGILSAEVLNRTAEILIDAGEISDAYSMLTRSLEMSPDQPILLPMLEIIKCKMAEN